MNRRQKPITLSIVLAVVIAGAILLPRLMAPSAQTPTVVVYCAHDAVFADDVLQRFEATTGIQVQVRYDEEASKSLGLTNLLISEAGQPRCDVFWNNQTLGTMRLKQAGVLAAYRSPESHRIPARFRDPEGYWTGFGARLRVWLVNTTLMQADLESIRIVLSGENLSTVAIAQPLFGTTLTHYSVLAAELGLGGLQEWHRTQRDRGIREARGNSAVKDLVAEGVCHLGYTDTDDACSAIDQGAPVKMIPVELDSGATICIPNTVAMIKACPHPASARRLIDFLLSEDTELELARSRSRQIPLGPVPADSLPPEVQRLLPWAARGADLSKAFEQHQDVLDWLTAEYRP